jgi:uronate dehydrogenase
MTGVECERVYERLLVTGAAGRIGAVLGPGLRDVARHLRLTDVEPVDAGGAAGEFVLADLRDFEATLTLLDGVDAVVHLAGIPGEATFAEILDHNLRGSANVFEAARRAGTRRVVFASSNHVTGFYPAGRPVSPDLPHRPDGFYGLSKCAVEDLGRLYHDKFGLEVACVRIGTFAPRPRDERELATWLSPDDAVRLFRCCLLADVGFDVVYGTSGNRRRWWPLPAHLGYEPADDAERFAADVSTDPVPGEAYQGGPFTRPEVTRFD